MTASPEAVTPTGSGSMVGCGKSGAALAVEFSILRPEARVLYMSGYTDEALTHHGVLDPGVHLITKPFNTADLTEQIRKILDTRHDR